MILYLASTQHTNLLDFTGWYAPDSDTPIKKMVGSFVLQQFVVHDMRNFSHFTDVVLDRPAFGDDDTGFANAIVSPAMEFKSEGLILGLGAKLFVIAGPVLVYGISASVIYGLILFLTGGGSV